MRACIDVRHLAGVHDAAEQRDRLLKIVPANERVCLRSCIAASEQCSPQHNVVELLERTGGMLDGKVLSESDSPSHIASPDRAVGCRIVSIISQHRGRPAGRDRLVQAAGLGETITP